MEFRSGGWVCWQTRVERLSGISNEQSYLHKEAQGMRLGRVDVRRSHGAPNPRPGTALDLHAPQETLRWSFRKAHSPRNSIPHRFPEIPAAPALAAASGANRTASSAIPFQHPECRLPPSNLSRGPLPGINWGFASTRTGPPSEKAIDARPCVEIAPKDHIHPCARHMGSDHMSVALQSTTGNFFFLHTASGLQRWACRCWLRSPFKPGSTTFGPSGLTVTSGGKGPCRLDVPQQPTHTTPAPGIQHP